MQSCSESGTAELSSHETVQSMTRCVISCPCLHFCLSGWWFAAHLAQCLRNSESPGGVRAKDLHVCYKTRHPEVLSFHSLLSALEIMDDSGLGALTYWAIGEASGISDMNQQCKNVMMPC